MEQQLFPKYQNSLGDFVADLRSWVFSTQVEAARHFGRDHATVSRYENGYSTPPLNYVASLAKLFVERMRTGGEHTEEQLQEFLQELNKAILRHYPDEELFQSWDEVCSLVEPPLPPPPPKPSTKERIRVLLEKWNVVLSVAGLIILLVIGGGIVYLLLSSSKSPIWQEDFDPIKKSWDQPLARWQDTEGPGAVLVENDPNNDFGKVESEVITVDVDTYPILKIVVTHVDLHASYSVQLLDQETGAERVVLEHEKSSKEHTINIADEMGWQGSHSFTINIWISGEGRSATFDLISIEAN